MFGTQKMMKYNDFLLLIDNFIIERVNAQTFIHSLGDRHELVLTVDVKRLLFPISYILLLLLFSIIIPK